MYVTYYSGEHNLYFGTDNNVDENGSVYPELDMWNDLKLIPVRTDIVAPEVESKEIDIPGAFGTINMTEFLTGYPIYKKRTGDFEFRLLEDADKSAVYERLMTYIHGHTLNVFEDNGGEPSPYFYTGYFTVSFTPEDNYTTVKISYAIQPYRINRELIMYTLTGSKEEIYIPEKRVYPFAFDPILITQTPESPSKFTYKNPELGLEETRVLLPGTNKLGSLGMISNLRGNNQMSFISDTSGSIIISFREHYI